MGRDGNGPEELLNRHDYLNNVFFSGDSAVANIDHHMAVKMTKEKIAGVHLEGIVLAHPYFWGKEPIADETKDPAVRDKIDTLWRLSNPNTSGSDDQCINPIDDPSFGSLGCNRVLVCVAEKDILKHRGMYYCEKLKQSGWGGEVELMEAKGEGHVFHLHNPSCENAAAKLKKVADFINNSKA
ncbi:hypothetical protein F3Y22_tig00000287pilonHSYRG00032 [Hibiscus syriacus]|uniref:Alpha/beta hydrolase fold-3 domain-containing protein n=1 Tax=Hibiscus syriacus TaxID=106335 RepID=A0A6A3D7M8_HIBSY|nr:hypothetical protein F3Y22_tig00000287pilonHSYRG00032 [Hibiscus syriacus]